MSPYRKSAPQQLLPEDQPRRLTYGRRICLELRKDSGYLDCIVFCDKCEFHTKEVLGKHNERVWDQDNPYTVVKVPHTSQKVAIWCGVLKPKIIGLNLFSEPTVTGENYKRLLRYFAMGKVLDLPASQIFQQNGAPSHWSADVRSYLDTKFFQRWIGRRDPIAKPARSIDLTPLDSFL